MSKRSHVKYVSHSLVLTKLLSLYLQVTSSIYFASDTFILPLKQLFLPCT